MTQADKTAIGIFVGGQSRRMGSPKGLLPMPGAVAGRSSIVEHLLSTAEQAKMFPIFVVGEAKAYRHLLPDTVRSLADNPDGVGPMGGLRALLLAAKAAQGSALAVACDMPHVQAAHVEAILAAAREHPEASIITPAPEVRGGRRRYEPMLSLYRPARVLPVLDALLGAGQHGMQRIFEHASLDGSVVAFERRRFESALRDWDTPEDVRRDQSALNLDASDA